MLDKNYFSKVVEDERKRFSNICGNILGLSFSQIERYYIFLNIILCRYRERSENFIKSSKALINASEPNSRSSSETINGLLEQQNEANKLLHLEIESFYLFAKILLDKIARFIEFYFGQARSAPLDSHDDVVKNIKKYAEIKGLIAISNDTMQLIKELKQNVSDYRDYEIAHEKNPRTTKGTGFGNCVESARIIGIKLYPKEKDRQIESGILSELIKQIDKYIMEIVTYISINKDKAKL